MININNLSTFLVATLAVGLANSCAAPARAAESSWPATSWMRADPASHGWSVEKLEEAEGYARGYGPTAVIIVHDGVVVASWGDVARKVNIRSMRKSLLSALFGIAASDGKIALNRTLADLGIDDRAPGLSDLERQASVRDLLMSRSGVYHPAAYEAPDQKAERPRRGSHAPGTFWYYNNWDFNALGFVYQRLTGDDIFQSLEEKIAKPIGMEDWKASDGKLVFEPVSEFPAYTMRMTARDLARFGWLYINHGFWSGQPIIPAGWVEESTRALSQTDRGLGYGYLWWVMPAGMVGGGTTSAPGGFLALGYGGQALAILPTERLVIVQLVDVPEGQERVATSRFFELMQRVIAARN